MTVSRRRFLEGSLGLFGLVLFPFRVPQLPVAGAASSQVPPLVPSGTITPAPELNSYFISGKHTLYLGLEGKAGKVRMQDVSITFPVDQNMLPLHPTQVQVAKLQGSVADLEPITKLCNIEHEDNLVLAINSFVPSGRIQEEPVMVPFTYGFRFLRPVVESIRDISASQATVIDAYGHNGGEDIYIRPEDRMMLVSDLCFACARPPVPLSAEDLLTFLKERPDEPSQYNPEKLMQDYIERRKHQTPEEREVEDERVRQYANNNKDLSAWERAKEELKGFDPNSVKSHWHYYPPKNK